MQSRAYVTYGQAPQSNKTDLLTFDHAPDLTRHVRGVPALS